MGEMTKRGIYVLMVFFLVITINIVRAAPSWHDIQGEVFISKGANAPDHTPVYINLTQTENTYKSFTGGQPGSNNNYSDSVFGEDGETIIIESWNATHYCRNQTTLAADPEVTYFNLTFNESRNPEASLEIESPTEDTIFTQNQKFNITFNVEVLGADGTGCTAEITISDQTIVNVSGKNLTLQLGSFSRGDSITKNWTLTALKEGSVYISIKSECSETDVVLEKNQTDLLENITINGLPVITLISPENESSTTEINLTFQYTVQDSEELENCSLYINGNFNKTNTSVVTGSTQIFRIYDKKPQKYKWYVECYDVLGASNQSIKFNHTVIGLAELKIIEILFSDSSPIEGNEIDLTANITNTGNIDSGSFDVEFYSGNYTKDDQIGSTQSVEISKKSYQEVTLKYNATIGLNNIFVIIDPPLDTDGVITERNENNNYNNNSFEVPSAHIIVGNITGNLELGNLAGKSLISWEVLNTTDTNIFVTDSDSSLSFNTLRAIGRDSNGVFRYNDFSEIDEIMKSTNLTDSINRTFYSNGALDYEGDITIFGNLIEDVPMINSTNSTYFQTGILWDYSDDDDGEFDSTDKEDIAFITQVKEAAYGKYGYYSYEIWIPAKLREYKTDTTNSVDLYVELK